MNYVKYFSGVLFLLLFFACTNMGEVDPVDTGNQNSSNSGSGDNNEDGNDSDTGGNEGEKSLTVTFKISREGVRKGDKVEFTNTTDGIGDDEIKSWLWKFGDGDSSTSKNPSHIYDEAGVYKVNLIIEDTDGGVYYDDSTQKIVVTMEDESYDMEPKILWKFDTHYRFVNVSPTLSFEDGLVYVVNDAKEGRGQDNIYAIHMEDGTIAWSYLADDIMRSTPAIGANGEMYVGGYDHNLYAFTSNGSLDWKTDLGGTVKYSSVAIGDDGTLYVGAGNTFYAINSDGSEKWNKDLGSTVQTTPAISKDGSTVFVGSNGGFYALNSDNGDIVWEDNDGAWNGTNVSIGSDGTVYFARENSGSTGRLMAYNPSNGDIKWKFKSATKFSYGGAAIGEDGTIYIASRGGRTMYALDPSDGSIEWSFQTVGDIKSFPAVDDHGNIYFGDDAGLFYVLSSKGEKKYTAMYLGTAIFSSSVIGKDGTIYAIARAGENDEHGYVFALQTEATGPANSAWPMCGKNGRGTNNAND